MIDLTMFAADSRSDHDCGCSRELCPFCTPRRDLIGALADVANERGLTLYQAIQLVTPDNVIRMEDFRK